MCKWGAVRNLGMKHFPRAANRRCGTSSRKNPFEMKTVKVRPSILRSLHIWMRSLARGSACSHRKWLPRKADADWMEEAIHSAGLTVGCLINSCPGRWSWAAYMADITYGTNNEFSFDYLRDNMVTYQGRTNSAWQTTYRRWGGLNPRSMKLISSPVRCWFKRYVSHCKCIRQDSHPWHYERWGRGWEQVHGITRWMKESPLMRPRYKGCRGYFGIELLGIEQYGA